MQRAHSPLGNLRTLSQLTPSKLANRRVLVRVDVNVELLGGRVRDMSRLQAVRQTVRWLVARRAKVILVAHRGRPVGRQLSCSLRPLVRPLTKAVGVPVTLVAARIGSAALRKKISALEPGQVVLLENIRFEPGETKNDTRLARTLAGYADIAVNEAFADSHRAHASITGLAKFVPMVAGFQLARELRSLKRWLGKPKHPYVAIVGGAKISTKLGLVRRLLTRADAVLLGGALANTVLKAEGVAVGASLIEPDMLRAAHGLKTTNAHLHIPVDVFVARAGGQKPIRRAVGNVQPSERILDIGPDTIDLFGRVLRTAKTVVWNGPMGVYERPPFERGTRALARLMAKQSAINIAGGGETVDAIRRQKLDTKFTFLSTGGGAMLEWLEGKTLPGISACMKGKYV